MAYTTYIDLVNALRNRFNETVLTTATWGTTIGFDQFSKDAINYAYHDILNAEMEWPFLHFTGSIKTTPGVQQYAVTASPVTGITSPLEVKTIDWDKISIQSNDTVTTISSEVHTIPSSPPYSVAVSQLASWSTDLGVQYNAGAAFTPVIGDPVSAGTYTLSPTTGGDGTYLFSSADAGQIIKISYTTAVAAASAQVVRPISLVRIDYDFWYQNFLQVDVEAQLLATSRATPKYVFKSNSPTVVNLSPVPDKVYSIIFHYWADGSDLVNTTDTPLLPSHFNQVLLDGAQKYCFEFREDPGMAQLADARFKAGITRMRIEQINRDQTMNAGFDWKRGTGYASPYLF